MPSDTPRQLFDEVADFVRGQGAVEVAPFFCGLCIEVVGAEDDLQGPAPAQHAGQALSAPATRQDAKGDLHLADDGLPQYAKAHIEGRGEFTASATHTSLDLGHGDLVHVLKGFAHFVKGIAGRSLRCLVEGEAKDRFHVEVGEEEVGIGALENEYANLIIGLHDFSQAREFEKEFHRDGVDRGVVDGRPSDSGV